MGADGGIILIALRKPNETNYRRIMELIKPFYFLTEYGNADWQEEANDKFLAENPEYCSVKYLQGTYGSFQDLDLSDLVEAYMIDEDEKYDPDPELTFLELLEDLDTRPEWQYSGWGLYKHTSLERLVLEVCRYDKDELSRRNKLGLLSDMKISDWCSEMRSLLDDRSYIEETWT